MIKKKFIGTMMPAKIPNERIGIKVEKQFAKNATDVVDEVTAMALTPLLKAKAILRF